MVQQRIEDIEAEDNRKTAVRSPGAAPARVAGGAEGNRSDDDDAETEAMHRFVPVRTALISRPEPVKPQAQPFEEAPTESMGFVDAQARPVSCASVDQRYEHITVLGTGGMGEVRLCKDRLIGRDVALKVMHDGSSADLRERFLREARIQGQLEHPAVVPVYDLGVDSQGGILFTMKRIRGQTLDSVLDRLREGNADAAAKYSRRKLLTAFSSVCLAVDFAHRRGVIHRDLKPENIMFGDFGEVYVLDWGIAKVTSAPTSADAEAIELTRDTMPETALGSLLGTPGYMSPEQACGAIDRLDARTDVYSLGAILFEIIAGETLHDPSLSTQKLLGSAIRGVDARPSARGRRNVPPELDAICVRATELDPESRFPSARALSDAIERFLDGDRDEELRLDLSKRHVAAARAAMALSSSGGEGAQGARALALREVGSALALNPGNFDALSTMACLLMDVSDQVPPEAEAELQIAAANARKDAARAGANRFILWVVFLPLALWMGVRHVPSTAAAIISMILCAAISWWMSRQRTINLRGGLALLLLSSVTVSLMSALFGPFILVPGLVATNTMFFAMSADERARRVVLAAGALTITVPFLLEAAGVLPPSYSFEGGLLQVLPRATELPALQTTLCLFVTSIAMVVVPGLLMGRMRDALTTAERRLVLQSWHLRQLVPGGGTDAFSPKETMLPTSASR
jgi:serine/threonine-protein kinase